jgi:hypothetical protein
VELRMMLIALEKRECVYCHEKLMDALCKSIKSKLKREKEGKLELTRLLLELSDLNVKIEEKRKIRS